MGGKTWSFEEEVFFWHEIVPQSPKAVDPTRRRVDWERCATIMKQRFGAQARRRYTKLMLFEHFFQNIETGHQSPRARRFVVEYKEQKREYDLQQYREGVARLVASKQNFPSVTSGIVDASTLTTNAPMSTATNSSAESVIEAVMPGQANGFTVAPHQAAPQAFMGSGPLTVQMPNSAPNMDPRSNAGVPWYLQPSVGDGANGNATDSAVDLNEEKDGSRHDSTKAVKLEDTEL